MADNKSEIRIGKVSSVNYAQGMIRVTYPDRDNSVTAEIPMFSFTDEYKMPKVGSQVLVVHLSNGTAAGVCLGHYWNERNVSKHTGEGIFRKELAQSYGEAYLDYSDGKLTIYAGEIEIVGKSVEIKADESITMTAPLITGNGEAAFTKNVHVKEDVTGNEKAVSLTKHTHTGVHGETSKPH